MTDGRFEGDRRSGEASMPEASSAETPTLPSALRHVVWRYMASLVVVYSLWDLPRLRAGLTLGNEAGVAALAYVVTLFWQAAADQKQVRRFRAAAGISEPTPSVSLMRMAFLLAVVADLGLVFLLNSWLTRPERLVLSAALASCVANFAIYATLKRHPLFRRSNIAYALAAFFAIGVLAEIMTLTFNSTTRGELYQNTSVAILYLRIILNSH